MYYIYGSKTFGKQLGYVGEKYACSECGKMYYDIIVKYTEWLHIYYIPLFPIKISYQRVCPACGYSARITRNEAKELLASEHSLIEQDIEYFTVRRLSKKPSGMFTDDRSYEFWLKDKNSGEVFCLWNDLTKKDVKSISAKFGVKNVSGITEE